MWSVTIKEENAGRHHAEWWTLNPAIKTLFKRWKYSYYIGIVVFPVTVKTWQKWQELEDSTSVKFSFLKSKIIWCFFPPRLSTLFIPSLSLKGVCLVFFFFSLKLYKPLKIWIHNGHSIRPLTALLKVQWTTTSQLFEVIAVQMTLFCTKINALRVYPPQRFACNSR